MWYDQLLNDNYIQETMFYSVDINMPWELYEWIYL